MFKRLKKSFGANSTNNIRETADILLPPNREVIDVLDTTATKNLRPESSDLSDTRSLIKLSEDDLRSNAERAHIALRVGAAHLQLGNSVEARRFIKAAKKWGCNKSEIARLLIAEVHRTLGKASEIHHNDYAARKHFENAVLLENGGSDTKLLTKARVAKHVASQKGTNSLFSSSSEWSTTASHYSSSDIIKNAPVLSCTQDSISNAAELSEILQELAQQKAAVAQLKNEFKNIIKTECTNVVRQLEAFLTLQAFLNKQERVPEMHGWPVSPDLGIFLVDLIEKNNYDLVIEFGSGTSTVLISTALRRVNREKSKPIQPVQVAFEHLAPYYEKTLMDLTSAGAKEAVRLVLAPLTEYISPKNERYSYYSCSIELKKLAADKALFKKILVFIDGPPGATGPHARYPALPIVLSFFSESDIDLLLDDYVRPDEKSVVEKWRNELSESGHTFTINTKKMEKDACLINITRQRQRPTPQEAL